MKSVADALDVARSNLAERAQPSASRPRPPYRKAVGAELLARVRPLADARPSYGYRRVTALLNCQAEAEGLARTHKRVYRVMKRKGLLLAPHAGRGRQWPHDPSRKARLEPALGRGRVRDPVLERRGRAGRVRDRYPTIATRGIGGIAVRDLMLLDVERRFGGLRTPQPVEWLADNGSCFTAHETLALAHAIGLIPRFTPVGSPESQWHRRGAREDLRTRGRPAQPQARRRPPSWPRSIAG